MPTRRGLLVAAAGAALLGAGFLFGYRELALLGALALVAVVIAIAMVGRPARFEVRRRIPVDRVAEGDTVTVTVELGAETAGRTARRRLVAAEWISDPDGRSRLPLALRAAPAQAVYELVAQRRGVLDIGPLEAGRVDSLGLAATIRRHGATDRVWVHPPVHRLRGVPGGAISDPDGHREAVQAGGLTFHGLREHVLGDDLRQIHWRSSARHGRLMVREYVDTSRPRVVVLVDQRAAGRDELDHVASAAASVLAVAVRSGLGCELHLTGGRSGDGRSGSSAMLDLLAEMTPTDPGQVTEEGAADPPAHPDLVRSCRLLRLRPIGDVVILISAAASTADLTVFGELRDCYAGLVAGLIGDTIRAGVPGLLVLTAASAEELAARWDEVTTWR
ncbi:DUF58 domain-containing protein [Actinomadura alba]|uniref:DUF58 domain-containing protein n=1 Tax=Actinomadura alba TaxID=406431 RepID=A0ABR7LYP8_9ACTN|nr:DUF58 domain-containing protein [Actinomadura alba]MBC6469985.1 DUF58 domain-containing protein [Actinomadura alba]